jgi:hypothetical protein
MKTLSAAFAAVLLMHSIAQATQVKAGSAEDQLFQRISTEADVDKKVKSLLEFERQFPRSKVLGDLYMMLVETYRQREDRPKIIEFGEKTLKVDADNVTAMIILARNYALEGNNLDRAVKLAERAVDRLGVMKTKGSSSGRYTPEQWKDYLASTESSARSVLEYTRSVKAYKDRVKGFNEAETTVR